MKRAMFIAGIVVVVAAGSAAFIYRQVSAPGGTAASTRQQASTHTSAPAYNKQAFSTTDPASIWVIVNKQHPLNPLAYAPTDLVSVGNGQYMRAEAATALAKMLADAQAAGYSITPGSGYRSYDTQLAVYTSEVKAFGQAYADTESARPGYSEHQTGWAVDLDSGGCNIADCFATTPGGRWVTANAYKYGFLLRYQAGLTDITGYRAEAWHFRYIGTSLATELHTEHVLTLEQFFGVSGGTTYK